MQLLYPLYEARQTLHTLASSYPSTGLDGWTIGMRLAALVDLFTQWGQWLLQPQDTTPTQPTPHGAIQWDKLTTQWDQFRAQLDTAEADTLPPAYPLQLRAYIQRHQTMQFPVTGEFGDNDTELHTLLEPVQQLHGIVHQRLRAWLDTQPDQLPSLPWWRQYGFWIVAVVGLVLYSAYSHMNQPAPPTKHIRGTLPKGAITGGITGSYYQGSTFKKLKQKRVDPDIWFHWRHAPIAGVPANYFSVRWVGYLQAPTTGTYKFCAEHNDGIRITIGFRTIMSRWQKRSFRAHCTSTQLKKGWHRLIVQMYDRAGPATAKLSWQIPGSKQTRKIETKRFCCRNQ